MFSESENNTNSAPTAQICPGVDLYLPKACHKLKENVGNFHGISLSSLTTLFGKKGASHISRKFFFYIRNLIKSCWAEEGGKVLAGRFQERDLKSNYVKGRLRRRRFKNFIAHTITRFRI